MVLDHLPYCIVYLERSSSVFRVGISFSLIQERIIGASIFSFFQLPGDRRLAEACLLGYGFMAVAIGAVDHNIFSMPAVYPVVAFHFPILTRYALRVTECL